MNYAVINSQTNIIEGIVIWDGVAPWTPPEDCCVQPVTNPYASIGWSYIDGQFFAPPEPTPDELG